MAGYATSKDAEGRFIAVPCADPENGYWTSLEAAQGAADQLNASLPGTPAPEPDRARDAARELRHWSAEARENHQIGRRTREMADTAAEVIEDLLGQLERREPGRPAIFGPGVMVIETSVPTDGTIVRISIEGDGVEDPSVTVAMQTRSSSAWMSGTWLPLTVTTDQAEAEALIVATTNPLDVADEDADDQIVFEDAVDPVELAWHEQQLREKGEGR